MNLAMFCEQQVHSNKEHKPLPVQVGVAALIPEVKEFHPPMLQALLMQMVSTVKKKKKNK